MVRRTYGFNDGSYTHRQTIDKSRIVTTNNMRHLGGEKRAQRRG